MVIFRDDRSAFLSESLNSIIFRVLKKKERHVAVVEPSTGRTLTGEKAPTESEVKSWLEENPTFEILKSHNKPAPSKYYFMNLLWSM
jgi:hypothetical protein